MSSSSPKKKEAVKTPKKAIVKTDYSYPKIAPRHKPIYLQYQMEGICASLKNSQQVVPGNTRLAKRMDQIAHSIAALENRGENVHYLVEELRQQYQELKTRIASGEDRARKNWLIQCERYKRWLDKVTVPFRIWMDDMATKHGISFPVGHIQIKILFYFPNLNRRDGPNKEQAIFDMLKAVGFIPDDTWTIIDECNWKARLYRPRPRTEIYITVLDPHRSLWADHLVEPKRSRNTKRKGLTGMLASDPDDRLV